MVGGGSMCYTEVWLGSFELMLQTINPVLGNLMNMCIPAQSWGSTKLRHYNTMRVT